MRSIPKKGISPGGLLEVLHVCITNLRSSDGLIQALMMLFNNTCCRITNLV